MTSKDKMMLGNFEHNILGQLKMIMVVIGF